ncbi:MAG: NAD(P)/FAD-dependent oxidoreductase [Anaerolineae bacterium]
MKIGIIGGGITGLTAAYELAKRGHEVSLFESEPDLGGQAATFPIEGTRLEKFYHHIFTGDREMIALIEELGLAEEMRWLPSKVGIYYGGEIYDFVTPLDLLRFRPLGLFQRLRTGIVTLYLQRFADWRNLENVTALEWVRRSVGQQPYEVIFRPLLRGKFGQHADEISMAWLWSKFKHRVASRGPGMQKELLGYMEGSFQALIDRLAERIGELSGEIYPGSPVKRVIIEGNRVTGLEIESAEGDAPVEHRFPLVIATVPSFVFLEIAPDLPEAYVARLRQVEYLGAVCLVLLSKEPLSRIYWLNISDTGFPFVGAIEQTNFIPPGVYNAKHIIYLSNYLSRHDPHYRLPPEELLTTYLPFLKKINPAFDEGWIEELWLFRADAAQPIITCDYSERIPPLWTPIEGLYLANTSQIYPQDRGMNYSVLLGQRAAEIVEKVEKGETL